MHGVQTAYYDVDKKLCHATPQSLLRVLQIMGVPVDETTSAESAVRRRRQELWEQTIEPVLVAWDEQVSLRLRHRADRSQQHLHLKIVCEAECRDVLTARLCDLPIERVRNVEGVEYVARRITLKDRLPPGYHRLHLQIGEETAESLVIASPSKAYSHATAGAPRRWGVFSPLYAIHSESSWGGGDFSDLEKMMSWVSNQGGSLVATLPLLAWLSEVSDDPSPYSAASRLFWNEFYLDLSRIPELQECSQAVELLSSPEVTATVTRLQAEPYVDYRQQMQLKRRVLMVLSQFYFSQNDSRQAGLHEFRRQHPELETYAKFRAVGEQQNAVWPLWPERIRRGHIQTGDYDEETFRYHLYTQWQVAQQLQSLAAHAQTNGMLWYLDFPLGVSGAGYDVWRNPLEFAQGVSGGAPPDAFFTKGQNWGFPPLHPNRLREQEYSYFVASLRRHLEYARLLRLDHVMGLHRLYWIPDGFDAKDGAYVRYRSEELFAILVLESHRHKAEIVGENLGTVPAAVDAALARHHIHDMYVAQFEFKPAQSPPLRTPPKLSVASLNTHDMPTFTAFWTGLDIDDRLELDLFDAEQAAAERERRANMRAAIAQYLREQELLDAESLDPQNVLTGLLSWLASSPADIVLVNLEDLWQETQPQNTPGTFRERRNWQKKLRYAFEEFRELPPVRDALAIVNRKRQTTAQQG